jgi:hypothetical protein
MSPHEEFLELAAAATSGEVNKEERRKLEEHLAICSSCRESLKQLENTILTAVPALALAVPDNNDAKSSSRYSVERGEARLFKSLDREDGKKGIEEGAPRGPADEHHRAYFPSRIRWGHLGLTSAAIALFALGLAITAYRSGKSREANGGAKAEASGRAVEEQLADAGHEANSLTAQLAERDQAITNLKQEMQQESADLKDLRAKLSAAVASAQNKGAQNDARAEENKRLLEEAKAAEVRYQDLQRMTEGLERERSEVSIRAHALEVKVTGLTEELRGNRETIARQAEYLDHDRDIRELMGARDLYIAEVYDVERNGDTNKPYGRVFYTRGKSLVFYAYDLDQQTALREAGTFQAWGRRGPDNQKALSLGVLYEDSVAKKRWVVRSNDPKTLKEIDAVFVTVEPNGGSQHPSSEPLLFAYLRVHPNHP